MEFVPQSVQSVVHVLVHSKYVEVLRGQQIKIIYRIVKSSNARY